MKDLNCVQLIGRLGQDPDVQYTDRGTARTTFTLPVAYANSIHPSPTNFLGVPSQLP